VDFKFKSKNEKNVYGLLCEIFPNTPIEYEYHVGQGLHVDFVVCSTNKIGVEVDGVQHYQYSSLFHSDAGGLKDQVSRDLNKEVLCSRKGITLVRVDCRKKVTLEALADMIAASLVLSSSVAAREETPEDQFHKDRERRRQEYADTYKQFRKKVRAEMKQRIKDAKNNGGTNG
jgi:very-short-patch-repair endonuclease